MLSTSSVFMLHFWWLVFWLFGSCPINQKKTVKTIDKSIVLDNLASKQFSTNMKVQKFKCPKKGPIEVIYSQLTDNDDIQKIELEINDGCHPELKNKLNALVPIGVSVMRLDEEYWLNAYVIGISLKHDTGGEIGCVLTMRLDLESECLIVNTRYLKPEELNFGHMRLLHIEMVECIKGKREFSQQELPLFPVESETATEPESESTSPDSIDYSAMTLKELRDVARANNIKGFMRLKQAELIQKLEEAI